MKILGIGSATVDYLGVLDRLPSFESSSEVEPFIRMLGGPIAASMIGLTRLGLEAHFIGEIGDDEDGVLIDSELWDYGVHQITPKEYCVGKSRLAIVFVHRESGERTFVYRRLTVKPLPKTLVDEISITSYAALHLDEASELSLAAAHFANLANVPVFFDGGWIGDRTEELLPLLDYPIVSHEFVKLWRPNSSVEEACVELAEIGRKRVGIVTLGEQGCIGYAAGKIVIANAFPCEVIDTTGAGDAFRVGFIAATLSNLSFDEALSAGNRVASLSCQELGSIGGLPYASQLKPYHIFDYKSYE